MSIIFQVDVLALVSHSLKQYGHNFAEIVDNIYHTLHVPHTLYCSKLSADRRICLNAYTQNL